MNEDLSTMLMRASAEVPELDFAERAWGAAVAARRRRRRTVAGVLAGVVLVAAAGTFWANRPQSTSTPASSPSVVGSVFTSDGVALDLAVEPGEEARLPQAGSAVASDLPARLGFDATAVLPTLSRVGGVDSPVRAVLLRIIGSGAYHPVLYLPRLAEPYLEVDTITLHMVGNVASGRGRIELGPRVIAPDRHRIAFVQPGAVVGLDVTTGRVSRSTIPDAGVEHGGWVPSGQWYLVSSSTRQWRVDPFTPSVQPLPAESVQPIAAERYDGAGLVQATDAGATLVTFSDEGTPRTVREAPGPLASTWPETVTSGAGWSASGVALNEAGRRATARTQGLYAVTNESRPRARLLLADPAVGDTPGCCTPLRWVLGTVLLYRSDSVTGARLLAWDIGSGRQWRVSELPAAGGTVGAPAAEVTLAEPEGSPAG